jgi:hypothetical protein
MASRPDPFIVVEIVEPVRDVLLFGYQVEFLAHSTKTISRLTSALFVNRGPTPKKVLHRTAHDNQDSWNPELHP